MYRWIVVLATNPDPLPLKPTPTPRIHITPSPTPSPIPVPSQQIGFDLTTFFLILTLLALAGLIAWMVWMFGTGRWISARKLAANAARVNIQQDLPGRTPEANVPRPTLVGSISPPPLSPQPQNLLQNKPYLGVVEECMELYHEFDGLFPKSDPRQEVAKLAMHRLQDILQRSGVETISRDHRYDIYRHQLVPPDPMVAPGTPIARIISPGFAVGDLVLLPAKVQVALTNEGKIEKERTDA